MVSAACELHHPHPGLSLFTGSLSGSTFDCSKHPSADALLLNRYNQPGCVATRSSKEMSVNQPPQPIPPTLEDPPRRRRLAASGARAATAAIASAAIAFTGLPAVQADTALPPAGSGFKFDFGPGATAAGYTHVDAGTQYSAAGKFGFTDTSATSGTDRGTGDALRSDFVQAQGSTFLVDLPNGDYTVKLIAGDATEATNIAITAEKMAKVQLTV